MKASSILLILTLLTGCDSFLGPGNKMYYVPVTVEPESIHKPNTPCEVEIDFNHMFEQLGENGVFDRFSISVVGKKPDNGKYIPVDFRVSEHFKYGLRGKVYWNIENPAMTEFRILFGTETNPPRKPREYIPAIGVGDELMFNTPELVPLVAMTTNLLADFNGDGSIDFIGCNESGFFVLFRNAVLTAEKPRVYLGMPVK